MKSLHPKKGTAGHQAIRMILQSGQCWRTAPPSVPGVPLRAGHHAHDTWEIFVPHEAALRFEVAGRPLLKVPPGALLLVPPGCVHMGIDVTSQSRRLLLSVLILPGIESPNGCLGYGGVSARGYRFLMTPEGHAEWCRILGMPPAEMLTRAVKVLEGDEWGQERGAAQVRLVLGAFAEAAGRTKGDGTVSLGEQRIRRAELILRERFYEPDLSLARVAAEVGISPAHMAMRFKAVTGRTFWKTLVEFRLRRARNLLAAGRHSVKEVAALTGWSSQLYFSAAFRKHYGIPPSRVIPQTGIFHYCPPAVRKQHTSPKHSPALGNRPARSIDS